MLLAIDAGNTNVVFALYEGRKLAARWRIATDPRRTGDEYAVWLMQLLAIRGVERQMIDRIIVSTVVPRALHNLEVLARSYFNVEPLLAGHAPADYGIDIDVDEPGSLGADRAVNAVAAHAKYPGDLIIVDFGTATTFDVVDFNGAYKGGIIAPGINLSLDALVGNTAMLPRIAIEVPETSSVIGRNTEDQMLIGVFWGYVAMMEGLVARIRSEIGRTAKVIATGGLAVLFDEATDIFDAVDADLTLDGLALLAEKGITGVIPGKELVFCALGGSGEIGMNVNLYGCDGKWLMVDLGMTFGSPEYPGIDLVFADLEFIEDNADDLIGIVITHAHEDHIGAVPYFAADLNVPIYATPFTARLIQGKLEEAGIGDKVDLRVIDHLDRFDLGPFGIRYVPLAHSIAEGNALVIDTPYGRIFHTGDWKLDDDPLVGEPTTAKELTAIGDEGVLALVCDSTNVFNPESSGSEGDVYRGLLEEVRRHSGKRVLVTTFASNIARLQTLGRVARKTGRSLCVAGRSLDKMIAAGQASGYLGDLPQRISFDAAMDMPRGEVLIVATGGQGEPRAALSRIAESSHSLSLEADDVVLFSSRQIPGNEIAIGRIQNRLAGNGVTLVSDRQSPIHVSGHPGRPELVALYGWLRPEVLVPVHGEMRHMREQARLGLDSGIGQAVVQKNGDLVRLAPGKPHKFGEVRAGRLILDGDIIAPADGESIVMRRRLAHSGIVVVAADARGAVEVAAMGLPLDEDYDAFTEEARGDVANALAKLNRKASRADRIEAARLAARRAATRWSGKKPQVQVLLLEE